MNNMEGARTLNKVILFLIVLLLFSLTNINANSETTFELQTVRGNLRLWGYEPANLYIFNTVDGENFYLDGEFLDEIRKIRQYEIIITGRVENNKLTVFDYNTGFDKSDNKENDALIIGEVFYDGENIILLTDDQYIIKIKSGLQKDDQGHKVLLRGSYKKIGYYQGEMTVLDYITIK